MLKVITKILGTLDNNTYIVYDEDNKECIVIDPADDAESIMQDIKDNGLKCIAILLTHAHADHIAAADELRDILRVKIYIYGDDLPMLMDANLNMSSSILGKSISFTADELLTDKEIIDLIGHKWQVIHTPGHTKGSCCFYIEDQKKLFSGDTLFRRGYGRTDLYGGSDEDMRHSLIDRLFILPDDIDVYPGHMGSTNIGYEKRNNPIFRER